MRVLWVGDACVSSGFARCTHAACDALVDAGHEVAVLGVNYWGDPHPHRYTVFPAIQPGEGARDVFGAGRIGPLTDRLKPDVVVLLTDPWNVPGYYVGLDAATHKPKVAAWLAVDGDGNEGGPLNRLDGLAVWTPWAGNSLVKGGYGGGFACIPLGVEPERFRPMPKEWARQLTLGGSPNVPRDAFIVGVVGRNQTRKRLDLTLAYFAEWVHTRNVKDAWLYLHVAPTGENGVDIKRLATYYGIAGRTILVNPHGYRGLGDDMMLATYNSFDLYLTTSQGEGFGLPALEAMACGVPAVLPEWAAFGDWAVGAARLVPCYETAVTAPIACETGMYTVGGIPDRRETIQALDELYTDREYREEKAQQCIERAARFPWSATGQGVVSWLGSVVASANEVVPAQPEAQAQEAEAI